jgi:hypothetical protein
MTYRRAVATVLVSMLIGACTGTAGAPASASVPVAGGSSPAAVTVPPGSDEPFPTASDGLPAPSPTPSVGAGSGGPDYRGSGASRTLMYSVAKCHGPTGGSWNVDIRESSGGGAFTYYEIPDGSDQAPAQIENEILLGDPATLNGTGTFVAGEPPHFVIENGEGTTDIELEVGTFCR